MPKKGLDYIPHFSAFIIVISLAKLILYYQNFNLPIKYYVGLSELGVLISEDLLFLAPLIALYFWIALYIVDKYPENKIDPVREIKRSVAIKLILLCVLIILYTTFLISLYDKVSLHNNIIAFLMTLGVFYVIALAFFPDIITNTFPTTKYPSGQLHLARNKLLR